MSYSIVIPSKTQANLDACTAAIRKSGGAARIIVVWDASEMYVLPTIRDDNTEVLMETQTFVFARNANTGIHAAGEEDVILLNDDAILETPNGFDALHEAALSSPTVGVVSALIRGGAAAVEQTCAYTPKAIAKPSVNTGQVRIVKHHMVAFIAVHIRRRAFDEIGMLDERFHPGSCEDDDFCRRCLDFGLNLGVFDGCIVEHGNTPSTFRPHSTPTTTGPDLYDLQANRDRFKQKWGKYPWEFKA